MGVERGLKGSNIHRSKRFHLHAYATYADTTTFTLCHLKASAEGLGFILILFSSPSSSIDWRSPYNLFRLI